MMGLVGSDEVVMGNEMLMIVFIVVTVYGKGMGVVRG